MAYELPFNERTRSFLRLQQVFQRISHHLQGDNYWDIHSVIMLVLDLYDLTSRSDIKREIIKELERQYYVLQHSGVDLANKRQLIHLLHEQKGQANQHLKASDFLTSIRQRSAASTTLCTYDLTAYHHWLLQPLHKCRGTLNEWLAPYRPLSDAIDDILSTIRNARTTETYIAESGFYQQSLDGGRSLQLLQLTVDGREDLYPEISAGKLRVSVRFMTFDSPDIKSFQTPDDITFHLHFCEV